MAKKLEIPYRSQRDTDALYAPSDCGAACVAMLLEAYGMNIKIDDIFKSTGKKQKDFLSRDDLINAAAKHHLELKKFQSGSKKLLMKTIDANKPFIALVNYVAWTEPGSEVNTQDKIFNKTHFVVVTGYDGDHVTINDPLWWGAHRLEGKDKRMTYDQFAEAWGRCHEFLKNPDFVGIVTKEPLPGQTTPGEAPVAEAEINRILAWAAFMGIAVDETILPSRQIADVYLTIMGKWGTTNVVNHVVTETDDLGILALLYYGDPMKWKVIANFNDLPPIDGFKPGDVLRIPEPTK